MGKLSSFLNHLLRDGREKSSEPLKSTFGPDASRTAADKAKKDEFDIELEKNRMGIF